MFSKVLIANRGEIALRIISACKELGIRTVAVYSEPDADSLHVRFADEDVCIGPAPSADSYLNIPRIISAAEITGADALHPGYGFLAESAYLAEVCEACQIKFIGPSPRAIRLMGDKSLARQAMMKAGVPVMRGSNGAVETKELALQLASEIGYPVILKASAGGGGRGMRIVANAEELPKAFLTAQQEADTAFGVADLYLESYLERPRHVEIQILADSLGNVVHLGERDCSIQRRHQKLLEESPSPAVTEPLRRKMGRIAVEGAQAAGYVNAGTVEFLLDEDDSFYFMEMNTRIQVEHPVTEMVTGIDIVKEQMRIAAGEPLGYTQKDISFTGASIECRINAEDPDTFVPSPGKIRAFHLPGGPGVRVDTASYAECNVPPHYDSLIAKLVVHGRDRKEAIQRMKRSLDLTVIEGIKTTLPLHRRILNDDDFVAGRFNTRFLEGLAAEKLVTTP
jgi:acetyl-CoA carboxylase biotin carboxylase subunit